jgi:hypothetical protein
MIDSMRYKLIDVTSQEQTCVLGTGCPAVFDLRRLTPEEQRCGIGACPEVYEQNKDCYLIIGRVVDAKQFGLEKKVGEGEMLISVPKGLIDGMKRE